MKLKIFSVAFEASYNLSSTNLFNLLSITYLPQYAPAKLVYVPVHGKYLILSPSLYSNHSPNQNCSSIPIWLSKLCQISKQSHAFCINPSQITLLWTSVTTYIVHLAITYSLMIALSLLLWTIISCSFDNIISPCQGRTICRHNLVIHFIWLFLSCLLWGQFSSPAHLIWH